MSNTTQSALVEEITRGLIKHVNYPEAEARQAAQEIVAAERQRTGDPRPGNKTR